MTYQKPELVSTGLAVNAIKAGLGKAMEIEDTDGQHSNTAYRSDE